MLTVPEPVVVRRLDDGCKLVVQPMIFTTKLCLESGQGAYIDEW